MGGDAHCKAVMRGSTISAPGELEGVGLMLADDDWLAPTGSVVEEALGGDVAEGLPERDGESATTVPTEKLMLTT